VAVVRRSTRASTPDRNGVERAINKLKQSRAVATRYDKRDYVWRGTVGVAAIQIWLRDPPVIYQTRPRPIR
jgi:transposase